MFLAGAWIIQDYHICTQEGVARKGYIGLQDFWKLAMIEEVKTHLKTSCTAPKTAEVEDEGDPLVLHEQAQK